VHKCLREHSKELSENCRREELRLEQSEAESIELNQGLLKACRDERSLFCKDVQPGQARVFRCLAENLGNADYGDACKFQVVMKLQRRCGGRRPEGRRRPRRPGLPAALLCPPPGPSRALGPGL
jgi:Golgi apparatus protein 1